MKNVIVQAQTNAFDLAKVKCDECFEKFAKCQMNYDFGIPLCPECREQNRGFGQ